MRLFVALEPAPGFRDALSRVQDRLRRAGVTGRYLDPANLHLTLAFIGEQPDPERVTALLPAVRRPFPITLGRLGVFPEAKVLWAGLRPSADLEELAGHVRQLLTDAGIPFDPRPFNPHITLIRKPVIPEGVRLTEIGMPRAAMTVSDVCLYLSERRDSGMAYTVIGRSRGDGPASPGKEQAPMLKVYCYDRCTTCKKALKWLNDHGIAYTPADIRADHPDADTLRHLYAVSGLPLKRFFNTSGMQYRELSLSEKLPSMSEEEQLALLASDGMLVKRPLLVGDGFVLTGFKEKEWEERLLPVSGKAN